MLPGWSRGRGARSCSAGSASATVLDRLLDAAREGHGGVLVVYGEPGRRQDGAARVRRRGGRGLPRRPGGRRRGRDGARVRRAPAAVLAEPRRSSSVCRTLSARRSRSRFGLSAGRAPNTFLVGLAVLGLLSEAAEEQPLLCVVDDAQWLDRASARALAFVARRLLAERIALVVRGARARPTRSPACRSSTSSRWAIAMRGRCWSRSCRRRLDERVLERIVVETRGNPLALLELPRGLTPAQLAGGFGLPAALPLSAGIEESFTRRLARLPRDARRLLLVAAAEPTGDLALLWRAAQRLGIPESAAHTVESDGLLALRTARGVPSSARALGGVRAAEPDERREVHRALAEATDPQIDPDRRAWHRAQAASVPDEDVAAELERSAARAQARGGFAAAAAFLERAPALTPGASRRRAAGARRGAGEAAGGRARRGARASSRRHERPARRVPAGPSRRAARPDLVRRERGSEAPPLLLTPRAGSSRSIPAGP